MKINCGKNIKKWRTRAGLSQLELGDKLGVNHGTISSWERDRTEPKIGQIEHMCIIFGCNKTDLIPSTVDMMIIEDHSKMEPVTADEYLILEQYRNSDLQTRDMVRRLLAYAKGLNDIEKK